MDLVNITIGLAFVAGLASFLSPCVFALVPAYIGYLSGRAAGGEVNDNNRWITFSHGLAFVIGFSIVFVALGAAASLIGRFTYDFRFALTKIGGIVIIIFGLHMIGVFRIKFFGLSGNRRGWVANVGQDGSLSHGDHQIWGCTTPIPNEPFFEYDTRIQQLPDRKWGYLSSGFMGVIFSAGWSPCVGPVLGAILTLSLNGGSVSHGVSLLSAYSAGLAIPFLIAALGVGWVSNILRKYGKVTHYIEMGMGALLVIVGLFLFTGIFGQIAQAGQFFWVDFGL